jgi:hypothetical protein
VQDEVRAEQLLGRAVIEARHAIWTKEQRWTPGGRAPARGDPEYRELVTLKLKLRDLVVSVPQARMPEDARQLWTRWEQHPWPIEERPTWVDG